MQRQGRASEGGLVKVRTARETCDVDVGGSGGAFIPEHLPFEARRNQVIQLPPSLPPSLVTSSSTPSPFLSLYCPSVLRVVPFRAQSTPPHRRAILGRRGRRGLSTRSPSSPAECRKTCLGTTCRPDRPRLLVHLVRLDLRLTRLHAVCYDAPCLPPYLPAAMMLRASLLPCPLTTPFCPTFVFAPSLYPAALTLIPLALSPPSCHAGLLLTYVHKRQQLLRRRRRRQRRTRRAVLQPSSRV